MSNQVETFRPQTSRVPCHGNTLRSLLSSVQLPSCAFPFSRLLSWLDPLNLASGFLAKDLPRRGQARAGGLAGAIQSIRTHTAGEEQVQPSLAGTVQSLSRQSRCNLFSKVRDKQGRGGRGRIRQGSRSTGVCAQVQPSRRVYSILLRRKPFTATQS